MSNIRKNLEAIHPSDAAKAVAIAVTVGNVTSVDHALAIYNAFLMQPEGADFVEFVDSLGEEGEGPYVFAEFADGHSSDLWNVIESDARMITAILDHFQTKAKP